MPIFLPILRLSSTLVSREWKLNCAVCRKALGYASQLWSWVNREQDGRALQNRSIPGLTCSAHVWCGQHRNQTWGLGVNSETWSQALLSLLVRTCTFFQRQPYEYAADDCEASSGVSLRYLLSLWMRKWMHKTNRVKTHAHYNRGQIIMPDVWINSLNAAVLPWPGTT